MGETACSLHAILLVASLSAVSLLVLSTMLLSVLMASGALQGLSGCPTCGASADNTAVSNLNEHFEVVRADVRDSIQLLNTSFQSLASLAVGPRGYNGSVGEEGPVGKPSPMATDGTISLGPHCRNVMEQCPLTSSQSTCSTPAVRQTGNHLTHYCRLSSTSETVATVRGATLASYVNGMDTFHYCRCEAVISQGSSTTCRYNTVICDWSSVNVTLAYP